MTFDKLNTDLWQAIRRQVFYLIDLMAKQDSENEEHNLPLWRKLVATRRGDIEDVLGMRRGGWTISNGEVVVWVSFIDGADELESMPTNRAMGELP